MFKQKLSIFKIIEKVSFHEHKLNVILNVWDTPQMHSSLNIMFRDANVFFGEKIF